MLNLTYVSVFTAVVIVTVAAVTVRWVRHLAMRNALFDVPNLRSSHSIPIPRLGGAAIIPIILLAWPIVSSWETLPPGLPWGFLSGAILLYGIGLVDDIISLSAQLRISLQLVAAFAFIVALLWFKPAALDSTGLPRWASAALSAVWIIGVSNIYNFMDGIDGIAGAQATVAGLAWYFMGHCFGAASTALLGLIIASSAIGFLTLNWSPAKIFLGDAGSTVLGYSFAVLPFLVWVEAKPATGFSALLVVGILVVWPFLADGAFTILRRMRKGENIFKAHRSHLYQRLVISGRSHQTVTLVYGVLAIVGAPLGWLVMRGYSWAIPLSAFVTLLLFGLLWGWTIASEKRAL